MDTMTPEGLEAMVAEVLDAARAAATVAASGFRTRPNVEHKGAVDLVTEWDLRSEEVLRARLSRSFPEIGVVGEEGGAPEDSTSELTFHVDPIDGTTNFVHGHPFWCVSIGLVRRGAPILGVVVAPVLQLEWSGWIAPTGERRAERAFAKGGVIAREECRVSQTSELREALLATGFPYDRWTSPENNFDTFVAIKKKCQAIRRCGSAAIDLCLVADGTYDGYWEMKLRTWDVAAGAALVRAAGGRVTDYEGCEDGVLADGLRRLIATNGALHDQLVSEVRMTI